MKIKPSRIIELVNVKRGGAHDLVSQNHAQ